MRPSLCHTAALLLASLAFGASAAEAPANPAQAGPYLAGVTTMLFVDHSRTDALTNAPRALMTEIWYPATDDTAGLPRNKLNDFYLRGTNAAVGMILQMAFQADLATAEKNFVNFAVRDARIREGQFPLVLFSHGNGGMRWQNVFLCEHLASHGYIVVSPDHTGNSGFTIVDGQIIGYNGAGREQAAADRPKDLSFLIDTMERLNKGGDSRFFGRIDMENIGVVGHSFGGYTAAAMADQDPRVDAIVPMAAVGRTRENFDMPVLLLIATEDDTINAEGNDRMRAYYEESKGPRYSVEFKNAGHYSFTEMYQLNPNFGDGVGSGKRITNGEPIDYIGMDKAYPLIKGYVTAFLDRYLRGEEGREAYLVENHAQGELIVKSGAPAVD